MSIPVAGAFFRLASIAAACAAARLGQCLWCDQRRRWPTIYIMDHCDDAFWVCDQRVTETALRVCLAWSPWLGVNLNLVTVHVVSLCGKGHQQLLCSASTSTHKVRWRNISRQ